MFVDALLKANDAIISTIIFKQILSYGIFSFTTRSCQTLGIKERQRLYLRRDAYVR
jgi:hypothetical protein